MEVDTMSKYCFISDHVYASVECCFTIRQVHLFHGTNLIDYLMDGTHWVALFINEQLGGEYFVSYGLLRPIRPTFYYSSRKYTWTWKYNDGGVLQSITSGVCVDRFVSISRYYFALE